MIKYYHHIFYITESTNLNDVIKNLLCTPAITVASRLTFNIEEVKDKHQEQMPLMDRTVNSGKKRQTRSSARSVTSPLMLRHFKSYKNRPTVYVNVIKNEFYCVRVKGKNLERQTSIEDDRQHRVMDIKQRGYFLVVCFCTQVNYFYWKSGWRFWLQTNVWRNEFLRSQVDESGERTDILRWSFNRNSCLWI